MAIFTNPVNLDTVQIRKMPELPVHAPGWAWIDSLKRSRVEIFDSNTQYEITGVDTDVTAMMDDFFNLKLETEPTNTISVMRFAYQFEVYRRGGDIDSLPAPTGLEFFIDGRFMPDLNNIVDIDLVSAQGLSQINSNDVERIRIQEQNAGVQAVAIQRIGGATTFSQTITDELSINTRLMPKIIYDFVNSRITFVIEETDGTVHEYSRTVLDLGNSSRFLRISYQRLEQTPAVFIINKWGFRYT